MSTDTLSLQTIAGFFALLASPMTNDPRDDPEAETYDKLVYSLYGPADGEQISIGDYLERSVELDNLYERGLFDVKELSGDTYSVRIGRVAQPEDAERISHLINRK